ncbi:MAG: hypothetical protein ACRDZO_13400 [Egibacteraceae bacterium]
MSTPLLVVGYTLAVPMVPIVLRIAWRRWVWAFVMLEIGTCCVALGWALRGQRFTAWLNAGFALGFATTWIVVGRVRHARNTQHPITAG